MERDNEPRAELIDLGAASIETKGPFGAVNDQKLGIGSTGLSDD